MADSRIGVFVTKETDALFFYHFTTCNLLNSIKVYNDLTAFRNSSHTHKVACLQMPYPLYPEFTTLVDELSSCSDRLLILASELHNTTVAFAQAHNHPKISYFICGDFHFTLIDSPVHKFYDWFTTTVHFYKNIRPTTLNALSPYTPKSKYFDMLLGRKKMHRDVAFNYVTANNLEISNIVTYIDHTNCEFDDPTKWIWELDGLGNKDNVHWTVDRLEYYGHRMSLSQIIPLTVYNQTAYSVVAETNWNDDYSFYTEKTVKPILGRRLFVMIGGYHYLKNLRDIGFKTFNGIIDESYDDQIWDIERFTEAMDQVKYLNTQPQEEILAKIKPICEHNYNIMINTDWYNDYFKTSFVSYFNQ